MQNNSSPLMPEIGIITLVPERWHEPVRARHQIMPRLAHYFNVVWIEPPEGWRECWFGKRDESAPTTDQPHVSGFTIYDPCPRYPKFYKPKFIADFTERGRLAEAKNILLSKGAKQIVLYIWRPIFDSALDHVTYDLSLYHIVDEYNFSETEKPNDNRETRLISRVNQVIIHSPGLMKKKGHLNSATTFIPNGVDFNLFATPRPEPDDMKNIPHPRVGYVGVIKKELDLNLLLQLVKKHNNWSFVFVGPIGYVGDHAYLIEELKSHSNVFFLGEKRLDQLPAYNQHIDVALLSYIDSAFNNYIFPLKLHEYLAAGCSVVGTPIETLKEFKHVVNLAVTADEWSNALVNAMAPEERSPEKIEFRRSVARRYDWNAIARDVGNVITNGLGSEYHARYRKIVDSE